MASTLDIIKVYPSEYAAGMAATFAGNRVPFIWGPPGVAKSAIAQKYATDRDMAFADIRLSQMDPTDLRGIPFPVVENGVHGVAWSAPLVLPRDLDINQVVKIDYAEKVTVSFKNSNPLGSNNIHYVQDPKVEVFLLLNGTETTGLRAVVFEQKPASVVVGITDEGGEKLYPGVVRVKVTGEARVIVGLEEFNSAPQSVQAASYQLILDGRLGDYVIPKHVKLMALGNRDTDKGITFKMPTPAANRFIHYEVEVDFKEWSDWAIKSDIHHTIIGFLYRFKDFLFQFEPSTASRGFATPRSWHMLSDILNAEENAFLTGKVFTAICCGAVGDAIGVQYVEFRKLADRLPDSDDILSGRLKHLSEHDVKQISADSSDSISKVQINISFALVSSLTYELHNRLKKIKDAFGKEFAKSEDFGKWIEQADNFFAFIMNNFDPEPCIMAGRIAVQTRGLPLLHKRMPHFATYAATFKEFLADDKKEEEEAAA